MASRSAEDIVEFIAPFVERAGIPAESIEVVSEGDGRFESNPVANVYVDMGKIHPFAAHEMMVRVEREISVELGTSVRSGFYAADIGFEDIAPGQALIQFDCLPFELDIQPALAFRACPSRHRVGCPFPTKP